MNVNILFVDDNKDACEAFSDLFFGSKIMVTVANSGEEAVEACRACDYDVIFMDLKMSGMGGLAASKAIRALRPKTKIFVLTGNTSADELAKLEHVGINDIIIKPYQPELILSIVTK